MTERARRCAAAACRENRFGIDPTFSCVENNLAALRGKL